MWRTGGGSYMEKQGKFDYNGNNDDRIQDKSSLEGKNNGKRDHGYSSRFVSTEKNGANPTELSTIYKGKITWGGGAGGGSETGNI